MDLMQFSHKEDTFTTILKSPVDGTTLLHDEIEMYITRLLPHTDKYKKTQYGKLQKYVSISRDKGSTDPEIDLYQAEKDRVDIISQTITDWKLFYEDHWVEFSPKKAKEVFSKAPWILDQLQEGEDKATGFTKA